MSSDIQVVIVNKRNSSSSDKGTAQRSPQEAALTGIATTNNLINEINFNSTVNRFEYLEELLSQQHQSFLESMNQAVAEQKEVIRQMKVVQRQVKEMKTPMINFNRVNAQGDELVRVKRESDKNLKLSQGMLAALAKMEAHLD